MKEIDTVENGEVIDGEEVCGGKQKSVLVGQRRERILLHTDTQTQTHRHSIQT